MILQNYMVGEYVIFSILPRIFKQLNIVTSTDASQIFFLASSACFGGTLFGQDIGAIGKYIPSQAFQILHHNSSIKSLYSLPSFPHL